MEFSSLGCLLTSTLKKSYDFVDNSGGFVVVVVVVMVGATFYCCF